MILEPNVIVLYVNDLARTSQFYQDLLDTKPIDASPLVLVAITWLLLALSLLMYKLN